MTTRAESIATLASIRIIQLTTIGRKSGEPRPIEIWWFHVDGRFIITGLPGPRDWYANVLAHPDVEISTSIGTFTATAVPIDDVDVRRAVFTEPSVNWYASRDGLDRLIETSPMVEVRLHLD